MRSPPSISSESSGYEDIETDTETKTITSAESKSENYKKIREQRLAALKDKLSSKGQSLKLMDMLHSNKENEILDLIRSRHTRVVLDVCLLWSCIHGNSSSIAHFLSLGANPEACDAEGFSAMHLAAEYNSSDSIKLLIRRGARIVGPFYVGQQERNHADYAFSKSIEYSNFKNLSLKMELMLMPV